MIQPYSESLPGNRAGTSHPQKPPESFCLVKSSTHHFSQKQSSTPMRRSGTGAGSVAEVAWVGVSLLAPSCSDAPTLGSL